MKRITITVDDTIDDADALQCIMQMVDQGKISGNGKYYCYAMTFNHPNYKNEIIAYTSTRTKGDNSAFTIKEIKNDRQL